MKNWDLPPAFTPRPDFTRLLHVLERRIPDRPVLFEFFLNERLYGRLVPHLETPPLYPPSTPQAAGASGDFRGLPQTELEKRRQVMLAFARAGYDYATILPPGFNFTSGQINRPKLKSVSQNSGSLLHMQSDLQHTTWPDPDSTDFNLIQELAQSMPQGMKLVLYGPGGVLENAIELVGYEALCILIKDDPALAEQIFGEVGSRLERYYQIGARLDCVGACISNDDWGFKTHTLFRPADMRRFIFPWHKRICAAIHAAGKPAILHSCGYFEKIIDDVIDDMHYDGRHSYEDGILAVEESYERYAQRIAILGGIDLDFICRSTPERIYQRSKAMLARAANRGSYALGTGNSVPEYVPDQGYFAMIQAAIEEWS